MKTKRLSMVLRVGLLVSFLLGGCASKPSQVTTVAGSVRGYADGPGIAAQFNAPLDVVVDDQGNLYVADSVNHCIRKITPDGEVTTFVGSAKVGYQDAIGGEARFSTPTGIAISPGGLLFVADSVEMDPHPMHVRQVTLAGAVTTLAGGSDAGSRDGVGKEAFFRTPANLAADKGGNVYVADSNNHRIRKITPAGQVTTLAGSESGFVDGSVDQARFNYPRSVAVDQSGNVYVADTGNHSIRKISTDGVVSTLAGGPKPGYADGKGSQAQFNYPTDIAVDAKGNLYVVDSANHRIRMITPDGTVSTIAGSGVPGYRDGAALEAQFRSPEGIAVDRKGNLYIADTGNNRIRKISR